MNKIIDTVSLEKEIATHDYFYWVENNPIISDAQYDSLVGKLQKLKPNSPLLSTVHGSVQNREKINQDKNDLMLSLKKAYTFREVVLWAQKVSRSPREKFSVSSKKDGLSAHYKNKKLYTRGDNGVSVDISDRIPYINMNLAHEGDHGEILIPKQVFLEKKPSRSNGELYKTERSAASGMINNLAPVQKDLLHFIPFKIDSLFIYLEDITNGSNKWWDILIKKIKNTPYPLDGIVFSLHDTAYGKSLGETSNHPKHSIAFKFGNPKGITRIVDVRWTCGKNEVSPTAILLPIEIDGYTNSKAYLHNLEEINRLGVAIGDTVEVERCGEIIPQIVRVVRKGKLRKKIECPTCPYCGAPTIKNGVHLMCSNKKCLGVVSRKLEGFVVRLGIERIGPATIKSLISSGVDTIEKLLNTTVDDFLKIDGFAIKSAKDSVGEIQRVISSPIWDYQLLACLNICGIGEAKAKKILKSISLKDLESMSLKELMIVPGVGSETAVALKSVGRLPEYTYLKKILKIKSYKGEKSLKQVCFTGKSDNPRDFWKKLAQYIGYEVKSSVTKDLGLLVCADTQSNSGKMKKAKKLKIPIISYENFLEYPSDLV